MSSQSMFRKALSEIISGGRRADRFIIKGLLSESVMVKMNGLDKVNAYLKEGASSQVTFHVS